MASLLDSDPRLVHHGIRKPWWCRYGWPLIHPVRFWRIWRTVRRYRQEGEEALRLWGQRAMMYGEIGLQERLRQMRENPTWPMTDA